MFTGNVKIEQKEYINHNGNKHKTKKAITFEYKCDNCGLTYWINSSHHNQIIKRKVRSYCSRECTYSNLTAEKHPQWKGGRYLCKDGYVRAHIATRFSKRFLMAHRLVMEEKLNRKLLPTETVHHINGIKSDNRPENLELWEHHHGPGQRKSDLIAENINLRIRITELETLLKLTLTNCNV